MGKQARLRGMIFVTRFPKTRSHNLLRRTIKAIANAEEVEQPCSIVNPAVIKHIKEARDKWWDNDPKLKSKMISWAAQWAAHQLRYRLAPSHRS